MAMYVIYNVCLFVLLPCILFIKIREIPLNLLHSMKHLKDRLVTCSMNKDKPYSTIKLSQKFKSSKFNIQDH